MTMRCSSGRRRIRAVPTLPVLPVLPVLPKLPAIPVLRAVRAIRTLCAIRATATVAAGFLAAALAGCDSGPTEPPIPTPGTLAVQLAASGAGITAVHLRVTGGAIISPTAGPAAAQLFARPGADSLEAILVGLSPGDVLRFVVPDTRRRDEYGVLILEAANANHEIVTGAGQHFAIEPAGR